MQVRIVRKLADVVDDIDLSRYAVGDVIDLPPHEAELLVAEGWASLADAKEAPRAPRSERSEAADAPPRRNRQRG